MLEQLEGRLHRFWFPAVPVARVALLRIAVAGFALFDASFFAGYIHRYTHVDLIFANPVHVMRFVGVFGSWRVSPTTFLILHAVLIVALILSLVGYRTRLALLTASVLYLHHFAMFNSWGKVNHGKITIIVALAVLAIAPAGLAYSFDALRRRRRGARIPDKGLGDTLDPLAGWALRVITVLIVLAYLISAYEKLTRTGITWVVEPILARSLMDSPGALEFWLVEHGWLLQALQGVTLTAEIAAVLLLFYGGWVRNILLAILASFHVGSYVLLETEFFGWVVTYLAFFALERVVPPMRAWYSDRLLNRAPLVVTVGPEPCLDCRHTVSVLRALDPTGKVRAARTAETASPALNARQMFRSVPGGWLGVIGSILPGMPRILREVRRGHVVAQRDSDPGPSPRVSASASM